MTSASIIDYSLIIAYMAIITDISLQISRIWKHRSAQEISILGTTVRLLATMVFLTKYVMIQDIYLTVGQAIFMVLLGSYLFSIIKFRVTYLGAQLKSIV